MDEWLNRDYLARILALFLAIVLWFVVVFDEQGEQKERLQASLIERIVSVKLAVRNLEPNLVATDIPDSVNIRVRGSIQGVKNVERNARAEVNLEGRKAGDNLVRVTPVLPPSVELLTVEPSSIVVKLEKIDKKNFPVKVSLIGSPSQGYSIGNAQVLPEEAAVKGPSGTVAQIRQLLAAVDVSDRTEDVAKSIDLYAADDEGRRIEGVQIAPFDAQVLIPIRRSWKVVDAEVQPDVQGEPAAGYDVKSVEVMPKTVRLIVGEQIPNIRKIGTAPVKITGQSVQVQSEVKLEPPVGASLVDARSAVVTVVIAPEVAETDGEGEGDVKGAAEGQ